MERKRREREGRWEMKREGAGRKGGREETTGTTCE